MLSARQLVSLETPLGGEDSSGTLGDLIADHTVRSTPDLAAESMLKRHLNDAMQVLSARERHVLRLRYGLDGHGRHTQAEIAEALGVSGERVHQIEASALVRLRRSALREYLDEYVA
jgi:RNA polymerase primary sigma factor